MREILFRGKRTINGDWVEGNLFIPDLPNKLTQILIGTDIYRIPYDVIPSTVGQYTGLTDKNGKKIFEGDIVKNDWCLVNGYSVVTFGQYKSLDMKKEYRQGHLGFYLEHIDEHEKWTVRKDLMYFVDKCEVVGNIHDSPELLERNDGNA